MARENSSRRGRNAADTAAVAAEVRTEVRLPSESVQFYIAGDILAGYVFVNKRVPLVVTGVTADNFEAVRARLSDLYGDHKTVCTASSEGGVRECALSQLPPGDYEYLRFGGKRLTARRRFDFSDLVEIMMALRAEGGCEWDRAQTHESIRINLIEEAYELVDAIDKGSREMMLEEAGDVLLQAVFHTQIALDNGEFGYSDMLTALCRKLLDRHTHIFGSNHAENAEQALGFWTEAKKKEKKYSSDADAMSRVPRCLPALLFAEKVQKIASRSGYDWKDAASAAEKVKEELGELLSAGKDERLEEAGDLLFAAVNAVRLSGVEPETALRAAADKFERRFAAAEKLAAKDGKKLSDCTAAELDDIWNAVKKTEKDTDR